MVGETRRGQTSTIGVLLLVVVAVITAMVLATVAFGLADGLLSDAPTASFDFDYDTDTGEAVVTLAQGQPIEAQHLRVSGEDGTRTDWPDRTLAAGDSVRFQALPGDEVRVGWRKQDMTKTFETYTVPPQSGAVTAAYWDRGTDGDSRAAFQHAFDDQTTGLQLTEDVGSLNVSQAADSASYGRYQTTLPANDGRLTVGFGFDAVSFEDSGIKLVAVDSTGTEYVIRCDESSNAFGSDIEIRCPSSSGDRSSFTWDGTETVTATGDASFERFYVLVDMENVAGTYLDSGEFTRLSVTVD